MTTLNKKFLIWFLRKDNMILSCSHIKSPTWVPVSISHPTNQIVALRLYEKLLLAAEVQEHINCFAHNSYITFLLFDYSNSAYPMTENFFLKKHTTVPVKQHYGCQYVGCIINKLLWNNKLS